MSGRGPDIHRTLLENLSDGVMVVGFDGSVRMANAAVCRMFGFASDEVAGRPFGELFVALEGFDEFTRIIFDAVVGRRDIARRVLRVSAGQERRSLSVTVSYLMAGEERVSVIAVVSDITELRELRETELRQAEVIETQFGELQGAYRDLAARNEALSTMTRRVRMVRGAAIAVRAGAVSRHRRLACAAAGPVQRHRCAQCRSGRGGGRPADRDRAAPRLRFHHRAAGPSVAGPRRRDREPDREPCERGACRPRRPRGGRRSPGRSRHRPACRGPSAGRGRSHQGPRPACRHRELGERPPKWRAPGRALRRAKISLDDAERHLGRTAFLLEEGLVPASQHEDAQRQRQSRTLDVEEAEREFAAVKARGGGKARRVARLEARTAEERLRAQEEKLDRARIGAPIAGVVMAAEGRTAKPLTKGRAVGQGELMLSIADLERLSVVTSVDEADVRKVEAGQRAWITGPGFPGLRVEGAVTRISSQADSRARRGGAPQFEVVVALDRLDAKARDRLRVGMSAHVTIVVHHRPAALMVPIDAVEHGGGQAWLRVLADDGAERRAVRLGLTTLDSVEVVQGLSPGDEVVLAR